MMQGAHMKLSSRSLPASGRIPGRCAFAVQAPFGHVRLGHNRNPQLTWRGAPATTKSFVLTMIDGDAPTRPDDVNREGRSVSARLPRAERSEEHTSELQSLMRISTAVFCL